MMSLRKHLRHNGHFMNKELRKKVMKKSKLKS